MKKAELLENLADYAGETPVQALIDVEIKDGVNPTFARIVHTAEAEDGAIVLVLDMPKKTRLPLTRPAKVRAGYSPSLEGGIIDLDSVAQWFARRGLPFHFQGMTRKPEAKPLIFIGWVKGLDGLGRSQGITANGLAERFHLVLTGIAPSGPVSVRWERPLPERQIKPATPPDEPAIPEPNFHPQIDEPKPSAFSWATFFRTVSNWSKA